VVVAPVDERHIDGRPSECSDRLKAAEPATDDDHVRAWLHGDDARFSQPTQSPCEAVS
jgi:hypothetical protein